MPSQEEESNNGDDTPPSADANTNNNNENATNTTENLGRAAWQELMRRQMQMGVHLQTQHQQQQLASIGGIGVSYSPLALQNALASAYARNAIVNQQMGIAFPVPVFNQQQFAVSPQGAAILLRQMQAQSQAVQVHAAQAEVVRARAQDTALKYLAQAQASVQAASMPQGQGLTANEAPTNQNKDGTKTLVHEPDPPSPVPTPAFGDGAVAEQPSEQSYQEALQKMITKKLQEKIKAKALNPQLNTSEQAAKKLKQLLHEEQPMQAAVQGGPIPSRQNALVGTLMMQQQLQVQQQQTEQNMFNAFNNTAQGANHAKACPKDVRGGDTKQQKASKPMKKRKMKQSQTNDALPNAKKTQPEEEFKRTEEFARRMKQLGDSYRKEQEIRARDKGAKGMATSREHTELKRTMANLLHSETTTPAASSTTPTEKPNEQPQSTREKHHEKSLSVAKKTLSKLDQVVNAMEDKNIREAAIEDRDNYHAKRSDMQQRYEDQIKEMEERLEIYTKLEGLAEEVADLQAERGANKNSRTNNMDGALDMIHLSLKNYRMLEQTADRLLQVDDRE